MNRAEFVAALDALMGPGTEYNSNNPWGFGGSVGRTWVRGWVRVKLGVASSRHAPPVKFVTVSFEGRRILDEVQSSGAFEVAVLLARQHVLPKEDANPKRPEVALA